MPVRVWSLLLLLLTAPAPAAELRTLSGKKYTGELVALDAKEVGLRTPKGAVKVPLAQILSLDLPGQPAPPPPADAHITDVELIDGSLLHCTKVTIKGATVELAVPPNLTVKAPLNAVVSILNNANDPKVQQQWQAVTNPRGKRDLLVVQRGDRLASVEGTFGDASADGETIAFETTVGQKKDVPLGIAQGMLFIRRQEGSVPPILCKVTDVGGNLLLARSAKLLSSGKLVLTTVAGVVLEYPSPAGLVKLDFSKGKLAFLSDLKWARRPTDAWASQTILQTQRDRDLYKQPIVLDGKTYDKGITFRVPEDLTFEIGGGYREFKATLGFLDWTTSLFRLGDVAVNVVIEGDGRELFRATLSRLDKPRPVTLDVRGVKKLRIEMSAAQGLPGESQPCLADAKVSK